MHQFWNQTTQSISEFIKMHGISNFPLCPQLGGTMIVGNGAPYIQTEYNSIIHSKEYRDILYDPSDKIERCNFHISTTCNTIHHVYHLFVYEQTTNESINDYDVIVEIGGGYGNMARLCYELGFRGKYIIHDLPEMVKIQKYYLKKYCSNYYKNIEWNQKVNPDLLIATWSLSEIPPEDREPYLSMDPNHILVAFSHTFEELQNYDLLKDTYPNIKQRSLYEIPHIKGSFYLLGSK